MSQLDTGHTTLVNAFKSHKKVIGNSMSHNMVLFYAVECGLKAMVCSSSFTGQHKRISNVILSSGEKATTHKINSLINHLKIPAKYGKCPRVKVKRDGQIVEHSEIHQAWRYGIKIEDTLETDAISWLKAMVVFLESKIS